MHRFVARGAPRTSFAVRGQFVRALSANAASPITPRGTNFSQWYQDVINAADLTDNSPVKGCAILKPNGYAVWEAVQRELDARIRATGAVNAYFPLLLPVSFLSREAEHVEGFAKECAVVTHHRLRTAANGSGVEPDPTARLAEPLVIRPTSETMIWDAYSRWIHSYRDLPLLINQWANVVRWEMRTRPFLRTSEFLWQEGHTAHASQAEARGFALRMLGVYRDLLQNVLAIPVFPGVKSPSERFAGADNTLTCEAILQNGWALQSATSHDLGQHFSKAFNVHFTNRNGEKELAWATSWGASTRMIGGVIMSHSDDTGLVLPPAVAPVQVVLMPIAPSSAASAAASGANKAKKSDATTAPSVPASEMIARCESVAAALRASSGLRVVVDSDIDTPPGARFYKWERKGVPLRLELGAKEFAANTLQAKLRVGDAATRTSTVSLSGGAGSASLGEQVQALLARVQTTLLQQGLARASSAVKRIDNYQDLKAEVARTAAASELHESEGVASGTATAGAGASAVSGKAAGKGGKGAAAVPYAPPFTSFLVPWADDAASEAAIKTETKYTLRCFPLAHPQHSDASASGSAAFPASLEDSALQHEAKGKKCFYSGKPATHMALFARAY